MVANQFLVRKGAEEFNRKHFTLMIQMIARAIRRVEHCRL